jgi:predicted DNA-binding protein
MKKPAPHSLVFLELSGLHLSYRTTEAIKREAERTGKPFRMILREAVERGMKDRVPA